MTMVTTIYFNGLMLDVEHEQVNIDNDPGCSMTTRSIVEVRVNKDALDAAEMATIDEIHELIDTEKERQYV